MIKLLKVRPNSRPVMYGNCGYKYYTIDFHNELTGKTYHRRHILQDLSGNWYTHTGNGEAECSLNESIINQLTPILGNDRIVLLN